MLCVHVTNLMKVSDDCETLDAESTTSEDPSTTTEGRIAEVVSVLTKEVFAEERTAILRDMEQIIENACKQDDKIKQDRQKLRDCLMKELQRDEMNIRTKRSTVRNQHAIDEGRANPPEIVPVDVITTEELGPEISWETLQQNHDQHRRSNLQKDYPALSEQFKKLKKRWKRRVGKIFLLHDCYICHARWDSSDERQRRELRANSPASTGQGIRKQSIRIYSYQQDRDAASACGRSRNSDGKKSFDTKDPEVKWFKSVEERYICVRKEFDAVSSHLQQDSPSCFPRIY